MGREIECRAHFDGQSADGKALLELNEIIFRGGMRFRVPLAGAKPSARNGQLRVDFPGGSARFDLGPAAEDWAHRILHPKSRIEKLGIKTASRVCVINVQDSSFASELDGRGIVKAQKNCDAVFFGAESPADLKKFKPLISRLKPDGALWIIRPKGAETSVTERAVSAACKAIGLVEVKVVSFSSTHTA